MNILLTHSYKVSLKVDFMKIKNNIINTCLFSLIIGSNSAYSGSVNDELNSLHSRLHKLETSSNESVSNVQLHGVVEVEYGYTEDYLDVDSSDIVLATVELAIEASINENVDVQVSLLHEEGDTDLEVDVGVINLHDDSMPVSISIGQMYVPFGSFDSNMISDPLTLELGETRESSILIRHESNGLSAGFYVFNGDVEEGSDEDKVTQFGFNLSVEQGDLNAGVDYISSISDTDTIQDSGVGATVVDQVAGLSVHASYAIDSMSMIFEYLSAMDSFDSTDMAFGANGANGAEPVAMNLEFAMEVSGGTVAVAYQMTDEAFALDLPEARTMIAYSTEIYESTSLAFEYLRDTDYDVAVVGGTGNSANTFTVQLATEF